ncbi:MAG: hypothetical protein GWO85_00465 [Simkaniaceae bacterium]|nr:hypothetical protein [Simkaniaceae bacterium]
MRSTDLDHILKPRPRKYRNLTKHLSDYLFTVEDHDTALSNEDIFQDLTSSRGTSRFLGYYSTKGIEMALELFGVYEKLKKYGLPKPRVKIDTNDPFLHKLTLIHTVKGKELISAELCVRRAPITLPDTPHTKADCLVIEWFLLQNPIKPFSRRRPQLPGQEHPGLGISMIIFEILYWMARRFNLDGVLLVPNYLHTGILYGRQCAFLDPFRQGELQVLSEAAAKKYSLDQLSWACAEGQLLNTKTNEIYEWIPAPIVQPVSRKLKDWFFNPEYSLKMRTRKESFSVAIKKNYRKRYSDDWTAL